MIDNMDCALGKNNFLAVKYFVPTVETCADHCRAKEVRICLNNNNFT